jgi:hypothetical protein
MSEGKFILEPSRKSKRQEFLEGNDNVMSE